MRGNRLKLHQGKSISDIRKNVFTGNVFQPGHKLPRAVMESPSLEGLKRFKEVQCLGMWGSGSLGSVELVDGLDDPRGLFPNYSMIVIDNIQS